MKSDNIDNNQIKRRRFVKLCLYTGTGLLAGNLFIFAGKKQDVQIKNYDDLLKFDWGYLIDITKCIGCGACVRACKIENNVPDKYYRTWVERYEITKNDKVTVDSLNGAIESFKMDNLPSGQTAKAFFVPRICNHCRNSACTQVCPVGATFHSPDGVVLIDKKHCVGCGYCVQACPYGCRYIDHKIGTSDKCTLCYHRIHRGLAPACVNACPRNARIFGNLKDKNSLLNKILHQRNYGILKPDLGTNPKCYYIGLDLEVK